MQKQSITYLSRCAKIRGRFLSSEEPQPEGCGPDVLLDQRGGERVNRGGSVETTELNQHTDQASSPRTKQEIQIGSLSRHIWGICLDAAILAICVPVNEGIVVAHLLALYVFENSQYTRW
jgi:hypothetical protein